MNRLRGLSRRAKKVSKEQNVPHHQALDIVAREKGFNDFSHFKGHYHEQKPTVDALDKIASLHLLFGPNHTSSSILINGKNIMFDSSIDAMMDGIKTTIYIDFFSEREILNISKIKTFDKQAIITKYKIPYLCLPIEWIHLQYNPYTSDNLSPQASTIAHHALKQLSHDGYHEEVYGEPMFRIDIPLNDIINSIQQKILDKRIVFAELKCNKENGIRTYLTLLEHNDQAYYATTSLIIKNIHVSEGFYLYPIFEAVTKVKLFWGTDLLSNQNLINNRIKCTSKFELKKILTKEGSNWFSIACSNDYWDIVMPKPSEQKNSDETNPNDGIYQKFYEADHICPNCGGIGIHVDSPSFYSAYDLSFSLECTGCGRSFNKDVTIDPENDL